MALPLFSISVIFNKVVLQMYKAYTEIQAGAPIDDLQYLCRKKGEISEGAADLNLTAATAGTSVWVLPKTQWPVLAQSP